MAKKTTLKTKTNEILYPQTLADVVYTSTNSNTTVNDVLSQYGDDIDALKATASKNKGWFVNETALLTAYPNNISTPSDRAGWYAIVGETENDALFVWDVDDNKWVDVGAYQVNGIRSINTTVLPDANGNAVLTGSDINATAGGETETITNHLGELYSAVDDINEDLTDLINKPTILYLTSTQLVNAVGSTEEYSAGQLAMCTDNLSNNYKVGAIYKYISTTENQTTTYSWEEFSTSGSIEELEGTNAKPINLYEIPAGYYLLSGYFKFGTNYSRLGAVGNVPPSGKIFIFVGEKTASNQRQIFFFNSSLTQMSAYGNSYDLVVLTSSVGVAVTIYSGESISTIVYATGLLNRYQGSSILEGLSTALAVDNTQSFVPTGLYNPATKKYVDDAVANNIPIDENANSSAVIRDKFLTSTSVSDNRLYYGKKTGETQGYISIPPAERYTSLYLDRSIVNHTFDTSGQQITSVQFDSSIGWGYWLQIWTQDGVVTYISNIFSGSPLYTTDDGWFDNGSSTGYLDLFENLEDYSGSQSGSVTWMQWTSGDETPPCEYLKTNTTINVITPIQLALESDLANVTSKEIDAFFEDNPSFMFEGERMYLSDLYGKDIEDSSDREWVEQYYSALFPTRIPYDEESFAITQNVEGDEATDTIISNLTYYLENDGVVFNYYLNGHVYDIEDIGYLSDKYTQEQVDTLLATKQNTLPTTTTAGKVLKSTSTSGTVEWGDVSLKTVTASSISIWNGLEDGDYIYTYKGQIYVYYWGTNTMNVMTVTGGGDTFVSCRTKNNVKYTTIVSSGAEDSYKGLHIYSFKTTSSDGAFKGYVVSTNTSGNYILNIPNIQTKNRMFSGYKNCLVTSMTDYYANISGLTRDLDASTNTYIDRQYVLLTTQPNDWSSTIGSTNTKYYRINSSSVSPYNYYVPITTATTFTANTYYELVDELYVNNKKVATTDQLVTTGTSAGDVPVLDNNGKLSTSVIPDVVMGQMEYKGTFDASTGATLTGLEKGWYYVCSVAGSKNPDGTTASYTYAIGDWAVYNGSTWDKIDNTDTVSSVNGYTGAVSLTASDVGALPSNTSYVSSVNGGTGNVTVYNTTENDITKFFVDNPSFKYNGSPVYLQDIAGKNLTDADVQAYLTALLTKYGSFNHNQDSRIPYTSTRWAVLQSTNMQTYTLYYVLPDQNAIYHLAPDASYDFAEGFDGLMDNVSAFKNDAGYLTSSTGVTSVNGSNGAITNVVQCTTAQTIVVCTQSEYDALVSGGTVSSTTIYLIKETTA